MKDHSKEDREQRERLERASPSGRRADMAGMLNALAQVHAAKEAPGLLAINVIRDLQKRSGYKTAADHNRAHAKFEKAVAEGFNRLHPASRLARHTSVSRDPE